MTAQEQAMTTAAESDLVKLLAVLENVCECAHYTTEDCPPCRARETLQALADRVERLTERCEQYKGQIEAGAARIARLEEALRFYADPRGKCDKVPDFYSELCFGETAQEALRK